MLRTASNGLAEWITHMLEQADEAMSKGDLQTAKGLYESLLKTAAPSKMPAVLAALGVIAYQQSQYETAKQYYSQSLALYREQHNTAKAAGMLINLGAVMLQQGDYEQAQAYLEESLALSRAENDLLRTALGLNLMAGIVSRRGDYERACRCFEEAIQAYRQLGQTGQLAASLGNVGIIRLGLGDHPAAQQHLNESIQLARQVDDPYVLASSLAKMGQVFIIQRDYSAAKAYLEESLQLRERVVDWRHMIDSLSLLVLTALDDEHQAHAYLMRALKLAAEVDADSAKLEVLVSAAYFYAKKGDVERSAAIASLVDGHPAMPDFMRPLYIKPLVEQFNLRLQPVASTDLEAVVRAHIDQLGG